MNVPVLVTPFRVAKTCTDVDAETGFVVTTKVADLVPAVTVTLGGMAATAGAPLPRLSETAVSTLTDAATLTVPVVLPPPVTVVGLNVTVVGTSGVTVRFAVLLVPLAAAES